MNNICALVYGISLGSWMANLHTGPQAGRLRQRLDFNGKKALRHSGDLPLRVSFDRLRMTAARVPAAF
jgi:hypothetical protein